MQDYHSLPELLIGCFEFVSINVMKAQIENQSFLLFTWAQSSASFHMELPFVKVIGAVKGHSTLLDFKFLGIFKFLLCR